MAHKLTDADLGRVRDLHDEGWSHADLADEFRISRQHVGRLVRHEQRPPIAGLDADAVRDSVGAAVDKLLGDVELTAADQVLAAAARALAGKLDSCAASSAAAAAQAA